MASRHKRTVIAACYPEPSDTTLWTGFRPLAFSTVVPGARQEHTHTISPQSCIRKARLVVAQIAIARFLPPERSSLLGMPFSCCLAAPMAHSLISRHPCHPCAGMQLTSKPPLHSGSSLVPLRHCEGRTPTRRPHALEIPTHRPNSFARFYAWFKALNKLMPWNNSIHQSPSPVYSSFSRSLRLGK